jgi:hypothetical protein
LKFTNIRRENFWSCTPELKEIYLFSSSSFQL